MTPAYPLAANALTKFEADISPKNPLWLQKLPLARQLLGTSAFITSRTYPTGYLSFASRRA